MSIHNNYNKLTPEEQAIVDETIDYMFSTARTIQVFLNGADPAERAAEALATFVVESRKGK